MGEKYVFLCNMITGGLPSVRWAHASCHHRERPVGPAKIIGAVGRQTGMGSRN